ncbi:unnamed protein product [Caenorhabditis brenneri]
MQFFSTRTKDIAPHYTNFGIIRFDTTTQGDFTFGTDWSPINTYFKSHLPTPSLSFASKDAGSDVLQMVDRFLDNTKAPVCGSELFILTKRYPNGTDISQLISKIRRYHSAVTFMASRKPSGGNSPEMMYDLASRTNGLCGFDDDNKMGYSIEFFPTCFNPFLIYAVNPLVSGKGNVQLPPISIPSESFVGFWFSMTVQDSGPINVVQTALLSWSNTTVYNKGSHIGLKDKDSGDDVLYGNHISNWEDMNKAIYSMTLDYEYLDSKSRRLQIRVHGRSSNPVNYWPPFDN